MSENYFTRSREVKVTPTLTRSTSRKNPVIANPPITPKNNQNNNNNFQQKEEELTEIQQEEMENKTDNNVSKSSQKRKIDARTTPQKNQLETNNLEALNSTNNNYNNPNNTMNSGINAYDDDDEDDENEDIIERAAKNLKEKYEDDITSTSNINTSTTNNNQEQQPLSFANQKKDLDSQTLDTTNDTNGNNTTATNATQNEESIEENGEEDEEEENIVFKPTIKNNSLPIYVNNTTSVNSTPSNGKVKYDYVPPPQDYPLITPIKKSNETINDTFAQEMPSTYFNNQFPNQSNGEEIENYENDEQNEEEEPIELKRGFMERLHSFFSLIIINPFFAVYGFFDRNKIFFLSSIIICLAISAIFVSNDIPISIPTRVKEFSSSVYKSTPIYSAFNKQTPEKVVTTTTSTTTVTTNSPNVVKVGLTEADLQLIDQHASLAVSRELNDKMKELINQYSKSSQSTLNDVPSDLLQKFEQFEKEMSNKLLSIEKQIKEHDHQGLSSISEMKNKENPKSLDGLTKDEIIILINSLIEKNNADKIGKPDYALSSLGSVVIDHSEEFKHASFGFSPINFINWLTIKQNPPAIVFDQDITPGNCFAFKGSQGNITIQLSQPITPESFSVDHIDPSVAIDFSSAPKTILVKGLEKLGDEGDELIKDVYVRGRGTVQNFTILKNSPYFGKPYQFYKLMILDNYGNSRYTCLYRFRVHGKN